MNKKLIAAFIAVIVLVAAVFVVWHYTSGDEEPEIKKITVTDYLERTVSFDSAPERVMCLGSSFTETMIYLDCFDSIVCVDASTISRLSSLYPEVSSFDTLSSGKPSTNTIEYCLEHNIDLVIVWGYYPDQVSQMESAGIAVIALYPKTLDDVYSTISLMGTVMEKEDKAAEVVSNMKSTISEIELKAKEKADALENPYKVYIELDSLSSGAYNAKSPSSESITGAMLDILGVDYIGKNSSGTSTYFQTEVIIEYLPDYMIYMGPRNQSDSEILRNGALGPDAPGWINENTVVDIYNVETNTGFNGNWASATPSLVDGLEYLYNLIYGE